MGGVCIPQLTSPHWAGTLKSLPHEHLSDGAASFLVSLFWGSLFHHFCVYPCPASFLLSFLLVLYLLSSLFPLFFHLLALHLLLLLLHSFLFLPFLLLLLHLLLLLLLLLLQPYHSSTTNVSSVAVALPPSTLLLLPPPPFSSLSSLFNRSLSLILISSAVQ